MAIFSVDTLDAAIEKWRNGTFIGYENDTAVSTIGGKASATLMLRGSLDPKGSWKNGIIQNSRYYSFMLHSDGTLELSTKHFSMPKFRKVKVKTVEAAVTKINEYLRGADVAKAGGQTSGLVVERALYDQDDRKKTLLAIYYLNGVNFDTIKSVLNRYAKGVQFKPLLNRILIEFVTTTPIAGKLKARLEEIPRVIAVSFNRTSRHGETTYLSKYGWESTEPYTMERNRTRETEHAMGISERIAKRIEEAASRVAGDTDLLHGSIKASIKHASKSEKTDAQKAFLKAARAYLKEVTK